MIKAPVIAIEEDPVLSEEFHQGVVDYVYNKRTHRIASFGASFESGLLFQIIKNNAQKRKII